MKLKHRGTALCQGRMEMDEFAKSTAEARVETLQNIIAQRAQRKAIEENNATMRAFNGVLLSGTKTAQNFAQIDDATSVR